MLMSEVFNELTNRLRAQFPEVMEVLTTLNIEAEVNGYLEGDTDGGSWALGEFLTERCNNQQLRILYGDSIEQSTIARFKQTMNKGKEHKNKEQHWPAAGRYEMDG